MVCEVGVCKVYFVFVVLVVKYFNVYGIDMLFVGELIVYDCSDDEVCQLIGVDKLIYQDLDDLISVCQEGNVEIEEFDCLVFNGYYLVGNIDGQYLFDLEMCCNDDVKKSWEKICVLVDNEVIDLYNFN